MEVCGSTAKPWFVRTNAWNGRSTVSQPIAPDVVADDIIVDSGGIYERAGGIPLGYRSSKDSAVSTTGRLSVPV
jgi:hypothetical protein